MKTDLPFLLQILIEACEQNLCHWKFVDEAASNIIRVQKGNRFFYASNSNVGAFPLNSNFAAQLAKDKTWSYKVLEQVGFCTPVSRSFYLRTAHHSLEKNTEEFRNAAIFADQIGFPVFVKPNSSFGGNFAAMIDDKSQLKQHLEAIMKIDFMAVIQEYIRLPEYRLFVLNGEVEFLYQRKKAPNASAANLASGGTIVNFTEQIPHEIRTSAKNIADSIGLAVCGIDIFARDLFGKPDDFIVIEVNSNPSLSGIFQLGHQQKVFEIWRKVLQQYFDE